MDDCSVLAVAAIAIVTAGGLVGLLRARSARRWLTALDAYADREITRHRRARKARPAGHFVGAR